MTGPLAGRLIERDWEVRELRAGVKRAGQGDGGLLLMTGAAGVGKTEVAHQGAQLARAAGLRVLEARGAELEQPFAFGVVRQLLEGVAREGGEWLFAGAAGPAARLFETDAKPLAANEAGFEALHSLYWLLVNLGEEGPLYVSVDDCQWADADSLRFLDYLARRIEELPALLLLAGRPATAEAGDVDRLWAQMASSTAAVALDPRPLSLAAVGEITRARLGADAAEELCEACHTATGGNPLYLRELLNSLEAAGIEPTAGATAQVQQVGSAAVSRFVLHRLEALGPAARELARAVAVIGEAGDLSMAAKVAGLEIEPAREAADQLARAEILAPGGPLRFSHPIVRAAVYEDLGPGERDSRHAAVAALLASEGAAAELQATHLLRTSPTGDPATVSTLREAAAAAMRKGSPQGAAAILERALAEPLGEETRAELLTELGSCEMASMRFERADQRLRLALESAASPEVRAAAATTLARCAMVSGGRSADFAADTLELLFEQLAQADRRRALELGCELLMVATVNAAMRERLARYLVQVGEVARGEPQFEAAVRIHAAHERLLGGGSGADAVSEVESALSAGVPPTIAPLILLLALVTIRIAEKFELAGQMLDIGLERARAEGRMAHVGLVLGHRAAVALAQGKLRDAQVEAETGLALVDERHFALPQLLAVGATVHLERGNLDVAQELVRRGEDLGLSEDRTYLDEFLVARGRLRIACGDLGGGAADLIWCGERLEALGMLQKAPWRAYAAPALAALGQRERAARLAAEQLELARRAGMPGVLALSLRASAEVTEDDSLRLELLQEAAQAVASSANRLESAYVHFALGRELIRAGQRRDGRDVLRASIQTAEKCGAQGLALRAKGELLGGPGRPARIEQTGTAALTAAEWRVCRQVSAGLTNREVAEALFITEKTVERHLSNAYRKLQIRSRRQLQAAIDADPSAGS